MFHPKTCPWNTRNSNSSLLSARLQRQKTISKPRGTGLWSRDVLHLLTNDVMKLCRDNCHALAWNDWNDWVLLYLIPLIYISLYIILYRTAPGQREIFRGSPSPGALGFFWGQSPMSPFQHPQVFSRKQQRFSIFSTFFSSHFDWLVLKKDPLGASCWFRETEEVHLQHLESCVDMFQFTSVAFQRFLLS